MKFIKLLSLLIPLLLLSCEQVTKLDTVISGSADLTSTNFDSGEIARLNGEWFYWPEELLDYTETKDQIDSGYNNFVKCPEIWKKLGPFSKSEAVETYGTIALKLSLPDDTESWAIRLPNANSATSLFFDDELIANIGKTSTSIQNFIPSNKLKIANFNTTSSSHILIMHISNFSTPYIGTWNSPVIGTLDDINNKRTWDIILSSLIAGALFYMGLYHLTLFLLRKDDKSTLWFGFICLFMGIRNLIMGERIFLELLPDTWLWWRIGFNIEHLSAHMVLPFFYLFFKNIFPKQVSKIAIKIVIFVSLLWALLQIMTPVMFHQRFLSWFEYFIFISAFYLVFTIIKAFLAKEDGAVITIVGLLVLLGTTVNDVLLSNGLIQSIYISSVGVFIYTFSQSFLLSQRFSKLFNIIAGFTKDLQELNTSLERFIPQRMLEFLGKNSIVDVQLGDFSEQEMSVFFLDIRDFTTFSETMSPKDNFRFINSFLKRFGPIIRENGGFVDKYIGDGIMALFPESPDSAFKAALLIREELINFNIERASYDLIPINVGIGINTGDLMLGTIGENMRMDSTVISDAVNTASRLESLTKVFNFDILVSEESINKLDDINIFKVTHAGKQHVKGKSKLIDIYALDWA